MLFRKRDKGIPPHLRTGEQETPKGGEEPAFYLIDFGMMKKGTVLQRRGKTIKQFAVTVNTATQVVTSGDVVDKAIYDALVVADAIEPAPDLTQVTDDLPSSAAKDLPAPATPSEE